MTLSTLPVLHHTVLVGEIVETPQPPATVLLTADLLRYLAELQRGEWEEPGDGAYIVANDTTAYVRSDRVGRQAGQPGDWYRLDGTDGGVGPYSWAEVRGYDEPPQDRKAVMTEQMFSLADVVQIVEQYARAVAAADA